MIIKYRDGKLTRLTWDIVIGDTPYYGYHYTSDDCTEDAWFICERDCSEDKIVDNLVYASSKDMGCSWKVCVEDHQYIKIKWGDRELRKSVTCTIYRNDKVFYQFSCGDHDYALAKAKMIMTSAHESMPFSVEDIDFEKDIVGRKIWYREQPAVIVSYYQGNISIVPDKEVGCEKFEMPNSWKNDDFLSDSWHDYEDRLSVDIFESSNISWYRK